MFVDVDGHRVHTVVHGSGPTTVVGLAGSFGNMELWQQPFEVLHHDIRTVAFDHLGTGATHAPPGDVTFENQVALVAGVLDALEIDRAVLLGDSSLSSVAVAAAHRWPHRVEGLVLVAGRVGDAPDDRTHDFVQGLRFAFDKVMPAFVDLCLPEDDDGHLRTWLQAIIARTGPDRSAHLVESFHDVDISSLLPQIEQPALVIHGDQDVINPPEHARRFVAELPDAELLLLPGCGHVPTLSRPREVAAAIASFVDRRVRGVPTSG